MMLPDQIHGLWEHCRWANFALVRVISSEEEPPDAAVRELAHVAATQDRWLARLLGHQPRSELWPTLSLSELGALLDRTHQGYEEFLADNSRIDGRLTYTSSSGTRFDGQASDVLLHVLLHGHYHRGKVNLLLRRSGSSPVPLDFILFRRSRS